MSLLMGGNDNKSISEAMAISASLLAHWLLLAKKNCNRWTIIETSLHKAPCWSIIEHYTWTNLLIVPDDNVMIKNMN